MKKATRYVNYARLAGYPIGLGLTSVLFSGTLNRVMIAELGLPASLVGLLFAVPLLVSPLRIWMGYRSDAYPLWGLRREPYIIFGSLLAGSGIVIGTLTGINVAPASVTRVGSVLLAFATYGLGKNMASNTFEALLADRFESRLLPMAATFGKIAMFVGIMGGAIALGKLLDPFSFSRLTSIIVGVVTLAFALAALATIRQEPRTALARAATRLARKTSFWTSFKTVIWNDPNVRFFFLFFMLTIIGTQAQDVFLEPYGALVLGMSVSETTRLTALWGVGTVLAMAAAGIWLVKRFGHRSIVRVGLLLNVVVFGGLIATGAFEMVVPFQGFVLLLGVGSGLSAAGMLTAAMEFTTLVRAGLLMGTWGMALAMGQAFGSLLGGGVVDLVLGLTGGNTLVAYSAVFAIEGGLLIVALALHSKVDLSESAAIAEAHQESAAAATLGLDS